MSIWPSTSRERWTSFSRSALAPMFALMAMARPGAEELIASATASQASCFRDDMTTDAPCAARVSAIALPMPRDAPVTTAPLPLKSKIPVIDQYRDGHPIALIQEG